MKSILADKKKFAENKKKFATVLKKAEELGVLDINFSGAHPTAGLASYERTLEIIEQHHEQLNKNAEQSFN
jgi:hypothetical protein